jgi:2-iminobutanoate/2-iminopropanoate deaminase
MTITHVNPESLHANPAFSQATIVQPGARSVHVGGQNGVDAQGRVVSDRLGTPTEQTSRNLLFVLDAAWATQDDVAKLTVHVVSGADIREAFAASQRVWGYHRTANPDFLVEIDAVAAVSVGVVRECQGGLASSNVPTPTPASVSRSGLAG